jgi:uncharacterized membrane protein (DUF485 family)
MEPAAYARIRRNSKFTEFVRQSGALARNLTIAILAIHLGSELYAVGLRRTNGIG